MVSAKQLAYDTIKQRINTCVYLPGDVLSESALMRDLGIGRTPIREALNKLESDSLLKIFPKRGVFITDISLQDVQDIYQMLEILEPEVSRLVTLYADKEPISELMRHYCAVSEDDYIKDYRQLDGELHGLLLSLCNNRLLQDFLRDLHTKNMRVRTLSKMHSIERIHQTRAEHIEIMDAICKGDSDQAFLLTKQHVLNGKSSALSN